MAGEQQKLPCNKVMLVGNTTGGDSSGRLRMWRVPDSRGVNPLTSSRSFRSAVSSGEATAPTCKHRGSSVRWDPSKGQGVAI